MKQVWYTSDNHFSHANIIAYCGRPFASVEEMNAEMIRRWNDRVAPNDKIYHLGDFAMGILEQTLPIGQQLNGRKVLVMGNHDPNPRRLIREAGFDEISKKPIVTTINGYRVCMQHYPLGRDEPFGNFDYRLCGHIHQKWKNRGAEINVGVDVWNFEPHTFEQLIEGIPPHYGKKSGE